MEDHYKAVVCKGGGNPGRSLSPTKRGAKTKSPGRPGVTSAGGSRKDASGPSSRVNQDKKSSKSNSKKKATKKERKKRGKKGGLGNKAGAGVATTPRKVYSSAKEFMAEHFPREEPQVGR